MTRTRIAAPLAALIVCASLFSSQALAQQVDSKTWMANMTEVMPGLFCNANNYFRQCFEVSEAECLQVATEMTRHCLDQMAGQIPAMLKLPEEGRQWGSQVGSCAGVAYERQLMANRINSARCNDPGNWTP